uniref:Uncharacterized protein n=1 Tax=Anguilla anguilla TaxID=7936 RepID=A0A0E9WEQ3_ANGAN
MFRLAVAVGLFLRREKRTRTPLGAVTLHGRDRWDLRGWFCASCPGFQA